MDQSGEETVALETDENCLKKRLNLNHVAQDLALGGRYIYSLDERCVYFIV